MKLKFSYFLLAFTAFLFSSCDPENVLKPIEKDTKLLFEWDDAKTQTITFSTASISSSSAKVIITGSAATITDGGYYSVSGQMNNGQLIVDAKDQVVKIQFNGITMNNDTTSPLFIRDAKKTIIFLKTGTTNTFTDGAAYTHVGDPNAAIFSKDYLGFTGDGNLVVNGNYNDAISSDDMLYIDNGNFSVKSIDDGIRGKDSLIVNNGNINVICSTGHALKSDNVLKPGKGYLKIAGGTLSLTSSDGDGIHTSKRLIIDGGNITARSLNSQALRSDSLVHISGGTSMVNASKKGIESPFITISGGTTTINSVKAGVNATYGLGGTTNDGSMLILSNGNLYINSDDGTGIDSSGDIIMSGGTVVVQGPSDKDKEGINYNGKFTISGGFLIASGPQSVLSVKAPGTESSQNSVRLTSSTMATNLINIQDASGKSIVTFKPIRSAYGLLLSSPELKIGDYKVFKGGTYEGGTTVNGYSKDGTYSNGTLVKTFTVTDKLTTISF